MVKQFDSSIPLIVNGVIGMIGGNVVIVSNDVIGGNVVISSSDVIGGNVAIGSNCVIGGNVAPGSSGETERNAALGSIGEIVKCQSREVSCNPTTSEYYCLQAPAAARH